jgi:RNA polymerase sigma factor (sigma-70 family)
MISKTTARYSTRLDAETVADLHAAIFTSFIEDNYRRLKDFEGRNQCSLRSWIRMISIRKTIDFLRKKKRKTVSMESLRETTGFEPATEEADVLNQLIDDETRRDQPSVERMMQGLPDSDRLLLELFLVQKLKASEVSRMLNISVGAVYTRKNRLIERMRGLRKKGTKDV